jgi:hypothetical protein
VVIGGECAPSGDGEESKTTFEERDLKMESLNYREFMESCGLDDRQVRIACKMFDSLGEEEIDGNGMGQVIMCMNAFIIEVIRRGVAADSEPTVAA